MNGEILSKIDQDPSVSKSNWFIGVAPFNARGTIHECTRGGLVETIMYNLYLVYAYFDM